MVTAVRLPAITLATPSESAGGALGHEGRGFGLGILCQQGVVLGAVLAIVLVITAAVALGATLRTAATARVGCCIAILLNLPICA